MKKQPVSLSAGRVFKSRTGVSVCISRNASGRVWYYPLNREGGLQMLSRGSFVATFPISIA